MNEKRRCHVRRRHRAQDGTDAPEEARSSFGLGRQGRAAHSLGQLGAGRSVVMRRSGIARIWGECDTIAMERTSQKTVLGV